MALAIARFRLGGRTVYPNVAYRLGGKYGGALSRFDAPAKRSLKMARCPPVPSPRAAKTLLVHQAQGEGQGRGHALFYARLRFSDPGEPADCGIDPRI